eukprot:scpid92646/ scgid26850/ 
MRVLATVVATDAVKPPVLGVSVVLLSLTGELCCVALILLAVQGCPLSDAFASSIDFFALSPAFAVVVAVPVESFHLYGFFRRSTHLSTCAQMGSKLLSGSRVGVLSWSLLFPFFPSCRFCHSQGIGGALGRNQCRSQGRWQWQSSCTSCHVHCQPHSWKA